MKKFWVICEKPGGSIISEFQEKYLAETHAERMAGENPTKTYYVLEAVARYEVSVKKSEPPQIAATPRKTFNWNDYSLYPYGDKG